MQIQLRDTDRQDHEAIFRIESHPMVRCNQYPWRWGTTFPIWQYSHFGPGVARVRYKYSTILWNDVVVGSISYHWVRTSAGTESHCGWNLDPDYWGRGIMSTALLLWMERHFAAYDSLGIVADCFYNNARCLRLLKRLQFQQEHVGFFERVMTMAQTNCGRWIVRHRLTRRTWEAARAQ